MNQVIDPVTGMPVPADPAQQMIQQPVNVGMPGSTPIPGGVGHNMQQPVQAGGRMLTPIRQNSNPLQDPTPNYPKGKNIGQDYIPKSKNFIEKTGDAVTKQVSNLKQAVGLDPIKQGSNISQDPIKT